MGTGVTFQIWSPENTYSPPPGGENVEVVVIGMGCFVSPAEAGDFRLISPAEAGDFRIISPAEAGD
jgi:hypothetical protein